MGNRVPSKTTHLPLETFKKNLKLERNLLKKILNHQKEINCYFYLSRTSKENLKINNHI